MTEFVAVSLKTQVLGRSVLAIMDGMGLVRTRAMKILAQNGINNLEPEQWYPQQSVLSTFKTISEKVGPSTLQTIGRKLPENAQFPPSINSISEALKSVEIAYRMNHRDAGPVVAYKFEPLTERSAQMVCENPYPCEMDHGLVEGMAERFRPKDSLRVQVAHAPGECRRRRGERCTYIVQW